MLRKLTLLIIFFIGCEDNILQQEIYNEGPPKNVFFLDSLFFPDDDFSLTDNTYQNILDNLGVLPETPDCNHPEFGPHILPKYDTFLEKNIFRFFLHKDIDNDRCINFDRQRNELKVNVQSPEWLQGKKNDQFFYSWKFKVDKKFKASPSFTHIHQLYPFGNKSKPPTLSYTITSLENDSNSEIFEIIFTDDSLEGSKIIQLDFDFKGRWISVEETVRYGMNGYLKIIIKDIERNQVLAFFENDSIPLWRFDGEFIRPKWGIYRSLDDINFLNDEYIDYSDFQIVKFRSILN